MSYEFPPMSDEELDALLPDGEYDFEVIKSERRTSAKGNPMAVLQVNIFDKNGTANSVTDFLIFSHVKFNIRKIKHFCSATDILADYEKGSLPEDFAGLSGKCVIRTQEEMPKENGGFYPRKNVIEDYVKKITSQQYEKKASQAESDFVDDADIPF